MTDTLTSEPFGALQRAIRDVDLRDAARPQRRRET